MGIHQRAEAFVKGLYSLGKRLGLDPEKLDRLVRHQRELDYYNQICQMCVEGIDLVDEST